MTRPRDTIEDRDLVTQAGRSWRFSPSRQEVVLVVAAISACALIVTVALLTLRTPDRAVSSLEDRTMSASAALEGAHREMAASYQQFATALASPPEQRAALVGESQRLGQLRDGHWQDYLRVDLGSPAEVELQRRYESVSKEIDAAGATVFGLVDSADTAAYQAAFARESNLATERLAILEEIRTRFYTPRIQSGFTDVKNSLADAGTWILATFAGVVVLLLGGASLLVRKTRGEERASDAREREHRTVGRRADLETQLQRGLEMDPTEEATFGIIRDALVGIRPARPVELLLSDSTRAHFHQAFSTHPNGATTGCPVTSPAECPATISGQTRVFLSSGRLDACPFLRNRDDEPCSATCIPVSIAGITTGVIHSMGPEGEVPDPTTLSELELVARKAGERIGYLRVLARSDTQARIDVLTGLFNRRSVEQQASEILERTEPFVVAFMDLDHFKGLNDEHGHEIGDRALRLFGRVLRDSVRPADIPARYGGEEFVVVLPDCTLTDARAVAVRIREQLQSALASANVPAFTVTVGLTAWEPPEAFSDTVARADTAMLYAKRSGRDRIMESAEVPSTDDTSPSEDPPVVSA